MTFSSVIRALWLPVSGRWVQIPLIKYFGTACYRCNHLQAPTIFTDVFGDKRSNSTSEACSGINKNTKIDFRKAKFAQQPCLKDELLCRVAEPVIDGRNKVTVVGAGMVGVACANAILFQRISSKIAIIDAFPKKLEGEGMEYCHGSMFMDNPHIDYDTDFCISSNSKVVIIAAGARPKKGESRLSLVQKNTEILKNIIPSLAQYSPDAVFIIVTNPVDILSWVTWKVSGLPVNKIIGSGTHLDSARFRHMIADRIGVAPSSVHGYIIGEHGDSQVPVWSGVNIAGVQFRDILPNIGLETDEENWHDLFKDVVKAGATVRCLKGYTNTAIGLAVADITNAIIRNTQEVKPVSTLIQKHLIAFHLLGNSTTLVPFHTLNH
ncbi:L-lactate dehydrogenase-like isoform X2 [Belonocnema kinseyi]|uniref:L-lactate dehydrogenase-like isoform X2 n=1 Tax=Belonocnema kinseyi TaxID=2817044 RepID=UPI00143D3108|nr:L-lactate dehydrogenase-like isoform X2 [Belonocnema kinseyi]